MRTRCYADLAKALFNTNFTMDSQAINELNYVGYLVEVMGESCSETFAHCIRVSNYSVGIGKQLGLGYVNIKTLWFASILHDIGKLYVPAEIINKNGPLTIDEYQIVKAHSRSGYQVISDIAILADAARVILYHHEQFDGKGYPYGIYGNDIPFLSRIITVADAFDAMTSRRAYRQAMQADKAFNELSTGKGHQFDGSIVEAFIGIANSELPSFSSIDVVLQA